MPVKFMVQYLIPFKTFLLGGVTLKPEEISVITRLLLKHNERLDYIGQVETKKDYGCQVIS